jgi:hypothetical protein
MFSEEYLKSLKVKRRIENYTIAKKLYIAACDMDIHDYDETAKDDIMNIAKEIENINHDKTLYVCLKCIEDNTNDITMED